MIHDAVVAEGTPVAFGVTRISAYCLKQINKRLTVVDRWTWPPLRVNAEFRNLFKCQGVVVLVLAAISVVALCQIEEVAWRRFLCINET